MLSFWVKSSFYFYSANGPLYCIGGTFNTSTFIEVGIEWVWENKALNEIILLTIQRHKEFGELHETLGSLRIHIDYDDSSYKILEEITSSKFFSENMEAVRDGHITERKFVDLCLQCIEKKFSGHNSAGIISCWNNF